MKTSQSIGRMGVIMAFGFVSGLPFALSQGTLQAWLAQSGCDLKTIGWLTLTAVPYTLKPLWAPFLDRFVPPFGGRRRGWILILQACLCGCLFMMSLQTPSQTLVALSLLALLLAFLSASNDVVIDAYRTDLLSSTERGVGSNFTQLGYRVAMMVSGALVLILSKPLGWGGAYQVMALVMAATMLVTWWSVEPAMPVQVPATLRQAVVEPLKDFATRPQMGWLLLFITFYKVGDATALSLSTAFFIKGVGFSVAEVGAVAKVTSFAALIIGTIIGGFLFLRLGLFRALLWFGVLQSLTNLLYSALALVGHDIRMLVAAVGVDYTAGAMGSAAFGALLMALCDRRFSAAQFALLTAIAAIPRSLVGPLAASLVEAIGWPSFFVVTFAIGLIPLGLLLKLKADVRAYDVER